MSNKKTHGLLLACVLLAGCADTVHSLDPASGVTADLRVSGDSVQYHEGHPPVDMEVGDAGADTKSNDELPTVDAIITRNLVVRPGQSGKVIGLAVKPTARTVAVWLDHDSAYWVVPVQGLDPERAPDLSAGANVAFADSIEPGERKLWFAAADKHGNFGPATYTTLTVASDVPEENLVVELLWDQDMDLDLFVQGPDGSSVSSAGYLDPTGAEVPSDPDAGVPFFYNDSNAGCAIDGSRKERAYFPGKLVRGNYEIFVKLARTCNFPQTGFTVNVYRHGKKIASRVGQVFGFQGVTPNEGPDGPGLHVTDIVID